VFSFHSVENFPPVFVRIRNITFLIVYTEYPAFLSLLFLFFSMTPVPVPFQQPSKIPSLLLYLVCLVLLCMSSELNSSYMTKKSMYSCLVDSDTVLLLLLHTRKT
jgi:hypothetical protein